MSGASPDFAAYEVKHATFRRMEAEVAPANKAALFEALAGAGIHTVVVTFDGCGDSGQIEDLNAFSVSVRPSHLDCRLDPVRPL